MRFPRRRYRGRLRQVMPMGDRTRGTVKVKVEILDPDDKLFPELAATVHFLPNKSAAEPRRQSLVCLRQQIGRIRGERPRLRLGRRPEECVIRNGRSRSRPPTDALARVESGLEPEEKVVLNPFKALRENEIVRIAD